MSPADYIESGLLEVYASGAASLAEQQEVERMAAAHPEVRAALDQLLDDMERFATLHAVAPAPALREKILGSITTSASATTGDGAAEKGKVIPLQPVSSRVKSFAAAASVVLLLSVGINVFLLYKVEKKSAAYDSLVIVADNANRNSQTATDANKEMLKKLEASQATLAFLRNPMTQTIALNTTDTAHPMKAMVHWDTQSKMVAVDPMTLPATAPDQQYVLWAIVGGKPVNEGGFSVSDTTGFLMLQSVPDADAFAISLEKSASVTAPEGPIYVQGLASR